MEEKSSIDMAAINEKIVNESGFIDALQFEMNKVIVGQKHMVERLLIGLLGQGHILLEGVPGLAKTLAINISLAKHAVQGKVCVKDFYAVSGLFGHFRFFMISLLYLSPFS